MHAGSIEGGTTGAIRTRWGPALRGMLALLTMGLAAEAGAVSLHTVGPRADRFGREPRLELVDAATAESTIQGKVLDASGSPVSINGLARGADGMLYGYSGSALYTFDVATGEVSEVGSLGLLDGPREGGLEFHPETGELWAILQDTGSFVSDIGTIDVTTGAATRETGLSLVGGDVLDTDFSAMAFLPDGTGLTLYGSNTSNFGNFLLGSIDISTGTVTPIGDTGMPLNGTAGLTYHGGTLYATNSEALYTVDPTTASATLVGTIDNGIDGLGTPYVGLAAVPEPGTALLVLGGLAPLALWRRRS